MSNSNQPGLSQMKRDDNDVEKAKVITIEQEPAGNSLLPMLVAGLVLIVVGMTIAMMVS